MDNIVTFYRNSPEAIAVNGERISEETITAVMEQFRDAPDPRHAAARSLVVRTLLRQRAATVGIEADNEEAAVEKLLEREVKLEPVADKEIRRYFDANRQRFRSGALFEVRHILFDTTRDGSDRATAQKAERALFHLKNNPEAFERVAAEESCCTSAKIGGALGQLSEGAVVPEFWVALVNFGKAGLLPQLVETRFGHHIVMIDHLALGEALPFEAVQARIRDYLTGRLEQLTYQQYVAQLVGQAHIVGIDLGDQRPKSAGPGLPAE
ncbi:peptidylprolyl isomerase [Azoarcus sp. PA01]|nr:peptidylprolyl isomerase [Azoarcus sp. PA01]